MMPDGEARRTRRKLVYGSSWRRASQRFASGFWDGLSRIQTQQSTLSCWGRKSSGIEKSAKKLLK
jgi:hypothetical protein